MKQKKTDIIILGAGISGLSLGYFLSSYSDQVEIQILEKSHHIGGWLRTEQSTGFHFEKGPRTFRAARSPAILDLAIELGLLDEIIYSDKKAEKRALWRAGKLRKMPDAFFIKALFCALLKEWRAPKGPVDESIEAFALRRFGPEIAQLFFDPMTLGIYAGDFRELSVKSCFPALKAWEEQHGSITKGFFKHLGVKKREGILSFKTGVNRLPQALVERGEFRLHLGEEAQQLRFTPDGVEVITQNQLWKADFVYSALPARAIGKLLAPIDPRSAAELCQIPMESIAVINLGYRQELLPFKAFGYLSPTAEGQKILGTVFDSMIFPQQNLHSQETRLTVMTKERADPMQIALNSVKKHLGVSVKPEACEVTECREALPQCTVGHIERIGALEKRLAQNLPRLKLVGNYLYGVSVNDCVTNAKGAAQAWKMSAS